MVTFSLPQLILPLLLLVCCITGNERVNRFRRQSAGENAGKVAMQSQYVDASQSAASSQSQGQSVRSRGFYDTPNFKTPSFSGDKPVGWFDTKYQNWVSDRNDASNPDTQLDPKSAPPNNLQGKSGHQKDDSGPLLLQKIASDYVARGEKHYNMDHHRPYGNQDHGSICTNSQSYGGYTFGRFRCPLPPGTGMNQRDRFCCGPPNNQYCCSAQEFHPHQGSGWGDNNQYDNDYQYKHHPHHSRFWRRFFVIFLPILCLVVAGVIAAVVFMLFKKRKSKQADPAPRSAEDYSAVPQNPPVDQWNH